MTIEATSPITAPSDQPGVTVHGTIGLLAGQLRARRAARIDPA
jgi:hypothetical protein